MRSLNLEYTGGNLGGRHRDFRVKRASSPPAGPLLGNAGPLARSGLERFGVRSVLRHLGYHGPPVSRSAHGGSRRASIAALAREPPQASGQDAEGVHPGLRSAGAHTGAELDPFVDRGDHRVGYEIKRTSSLRTTPSMRSALRDLELAELTVIHAGERSFPMTESVRAVAAGRLLEDLRVQARLICR